MSIPTPFNPLGTLGTGYIKDGLMLHFDGASEPQGTRPEITNQVTGAKVAATKNLNFNENYFTLNGAYIEYPTLPEGVVYGEMVTEFREVGQSYQVTLYFNDGFATKMRSFGNYPFAPGNHNWGTGFSNLKETGIYGFARCGMVKGDFAATNPNLVPYAAPVGGINDNTNLMWGNGDLRVFSVRLYNRELTPNEIMHNIKVDMKLFKQ